MNKLLKAIMAGALLAGLAHARVARAADPGASNGPTFQEVCDLLRANAPSVSEADLNRAAVQGILNRYAAVATLATNASGAGGGAEAALLSKTTIFDGAYGYLRVGRVDTGLAEKIGAAYAQLSATNKLNGLVLDLRFADGQDYEAAARAADKFITTEQPLLAWGDRTIRSTGKSGAITLRLAVLVNRQTVGAAEALAAILRHAEVGLLIGTNTAGRAYLFKDFPLRGGEHLRIATTMVRLGNDQPLPGDGLKPDIQIVVNPEEERAYFADAYKVLTVKVPVLFTSNVTNSSGSGAATNAEAAHRINEAELVRRQKEGQNPEETATEAASRATEAAKPVVQDPALARALDLLKGLAVVQMQLRQP
ncbi:MAG: S41 family peptidase [Limisphaerales bacterium]